MERWNYPRGLGAIDDKHIQVQGFGNSVSTFQNFKHCFSIVLLAIADADYDFLFVDIGTEGASNDAGINNQSSFKTALSSGASQFPTVPRNDPLEVQYHLRGDTAFPLTESMMKPFHQKSLDPKEQIFNYRFSHSLFLL